MRTGQTLQRCEGEEPWWEWSAHIRSARPETLPSPGRTDVRSEPGRMPEHTGRPAWGCSGLFRLAGQRSVNRQCGREMRRTRNSRARPLESAPSGRPPWAAGTVAETPAPTSQPDPAADRIVRPAETP